MAMLAITEVPGIGPERAALLAEHGITTLRRLARSSVAQLTKISGIGPVTARGAQRAAKALLASAEDEGPTESERGKKGKDKKKKHKKDKRKDKKKKRKKDKRKDKKKKRKKDKRKDKKKKKKRGK